MDSRQRQRPSAALVASRKEVDLLRLWGVLIDMSMSTTPCDRTCACVMLGTWTETLDFPYLWWLGLVWQQQVV